MRGPGSEGIYAAPDGFPRPRAAPLGKGRYHATLPAPPDLEMTQSGGLWENQTPELTSLGDDLIRVPGHGPPSPSPGLQGPAQDRRGAAPLLVHPAPRRGQCWGPSSEHAGSQNPGVPGSALMTPPRAPLGVPGPRLPRPSVVRPLPPPRRPLLPPLSAEVPTSSLSEKQADHTSLPDGAEDNGAHRRPEFGPGSLGGPGVPGETGQDRGFPFKM